MELFTAWLATFGALFAVIDPFGYVPIFLSMTAGSSQEERQWILKKACLTSFIVLCAFALTGKMFLGYFGISIPALEISGGLILVVIAFQMLQLHTTTKLSDEEESTASRKEDISIVPLAIPMLAGPASFATIAVLNAQMKGPTDYLILLAAILVNVALTYWILRSSNRLLNLLGTIGLNILTRLMGLLLCAMAVQSIINGFLAIQR